MISRETKITLSYWKVRVVKCLSYQGKCIEEIHVKLTLVCVSARFKLSRVRVMKSQMYLNLPLQVWTRC